MSAESGKAGYTPGPWASKGHGVIVGGPFRQFTNGKAQSQIAMVCLMTEGTIDDPSAERDANARLIAAAPALVEALTRLHEACDDSDGFNYGTLSTSFVRGICTDALRSAGVVLS